MSHQVPVLRGLKVIDFGQYVAGPLAGMLLADYGAEVVKVNPPGGPVYTSPGNAMWNRSKSSVSLDLKTSEGQQAARDLIAGADVVIENFRPGTMAGWGLAYDQVVASNPGLIYLSLPGFASSDPRAGQQAWEGTIHAALDGFRPKIPYQELGIQTWIHPDDRAGAPLPVSDRIASSYAAILGCNCVVAALLVRHKTGAGQAIEVPLFDAMLQGIGLGASVTVPHAPHTGPVFTPLELQYECADGRYFHLICSIERHGRAFLGYVGRGDLIDRGLTRTDIIGRPDEYSELYSIVKDVFLQRTSKEWEAVFHQLGLPGSICQTLDEFIQSDLARAGNLLSRSPETGSLQPNTPVLLTPAPGQSRKSARLHGVSAADGHEFPANAITARAPLAGIKVLDLCIILAGPVSGRTLAEFGADVVKIDDPIRGANAFHEDVNRGKKSIFLDLRDDADRATFWELAEKADVIVQNFRLKVLEKYGVTPEEIRRRNPDAIWVSSNAYGDVGPWAHLPGYEGSVQAATGLQVRYGGATAVTSYPYAVHDYATGYLSGLGVLLALYERSKTGQVNYVHGALLRTASLLQSEAWMAALASPVPEVSRDGFFERIIPCQRGWIHVATKDISAGREALGIDATQDLGEHLSSMCAKVDKSVAVEQLLALGLSAHALTSLREVMTSPSNQARGISVLRHNFRNVVKAYAAPGQWMSLTRIEMGRAAPVPGSGLTQ